jgi:hypothetical protein
MRPHHAQARTDKPVPTDLPPATTIGTGRGDSVTRVTQSSSGGAIIPDGLEKFDEIPANARRVTNAHAIAANARLAGSQGPSSLVIRRVIHRTVISGTQKIPSALSTCQRT